MPETQTPTNTAQADNNPTTVIPNNDTSNISTSANIEAEDGNITFPGDAGKVEETSDNPNTTKPVVDISKIPNFKDFKTREVTKEKPVETKTKPETTEDLTEQEKGQTQNNNPPPKPNVNGRDYSNIEPAYIPHFKKMSNESFSALKPIYLENKKLKEENTKLANQKRADGLPPNYYEHPEAYVLSPEYKTQSMRANVAQQLEDHWIDQLSAIEEGNKWKDVSLDKEGNLVYSAPQDTSPEARAFIRRSLNIVQKQNAQEQGKLVTIQQGFKAKRDASVNVIKGFEEKYFPGWDKEDHATHKLQQEIISQYPEEYRDHPTTSLLAKTGAALAQAQGVITVLKAELEKYIGKKTDSSKAQPTNGNFQGANGRLPAAVKFGDFKNRE